MGTRADFYVGRGADAEWLGSVAWDGNPGGFDADLYKVESEQGWRIRVGRELAGRRDSTMPDLGWPWPWDDSRTTDYAYAWDDGVVYASSFGTAWFAVDPDADDHGEPDDELYEKTAVFPDMTDRKAVTFGPRSGVMVFRA